MLSQLFRILLVFVLLILVQDLAFSLEVSRDSAGRLILKGSTCREVEAQAVSLRIWQKKLSESEPNDNPSCRCNMAYCNLDITSSAPSFVRTFQGFISPRWGPNCWNTALNASKILNGIRFSYPQEMRLWMSSSQCRELGAREDSEPGDVLAIRDQNDDEVHGFIFVSDLLVFSKNDLSTASPIALQDTEKVYKIFPVSKECRQHYGGASPSCPIYTNRFRCLGEGSPSILLPYLAETALRIEQNELLVQTLVLRWKTDKVMRFHLAEIVSRVREELMSLRSFLVANQKHFSEAVLFWKVEGILHQLELVE
jgi:hypothetical protein